ncbi:B12-binding domain-containing radical SAM protein [Desulfatirhabdium butyrativorans]|uniref:B12-binding domain-containing radical SAM protein n=1 Tax=Desulfatirhabdium butyrativorans TaxID=340467 RepID=UPI0003FF126C|nr:radical SAM protein [Desulfatirhabdium butyrativorans]
MNRILLIKPPYSRLKQVGQAPYFPLGLGYVGAVLEQAGFEVGIYHAENPRSENECIVEDEEAIFHQRSKAQQRYHDAVRDDSHPVWQEIRQTLTDFRPDVVGISVLTVETASALKISWLCKEYDSRIPVVWGGIHPTFMTDQVLGYGPVDMVVRGEGEMTFLELCSRIREGNLNITDIPGLSFKNEANEIIHNAPRPLIKDVDSIPFPATHLLLYPESFHFKSIGSMIVSRGCPLRCTFCSSRLFWERRVRLRSADNIIQEIQSLQARHHAKYIMFWDDSFSINKEMVIKYCKRFIEAQLNVKWRTATRADLVDDELLCWMKKAGCVKLEIGVESGSPRIQKMIRKDVDNQIVQRAFKLIQKHHIATGAFFMAGFPEETEEDMQMSWDLMKALGIEEIAYNIFDPMPGSELLERCQELGLVPPEPDWAHFDFWPDGFFMKNMTPERFAEKATQIGKWVYAYNNRFSVKFNKLKALSWFYIKNDPVLFFKKAAHYIQRRRMVRRLGQA